MTRYARPGLERLEDRCVCANLDGLLMPGVTIGGSYGREAVKAVLKILDQATRPAIIRASAAPSVRAESAPRGGGQSSSARLYEPLPALKGTTLKDAVFTMDLLTPLDLIRDNNGKRLVLRSFR